MGWPGGGLQNLARAVPGNEGREKEKQGSSVDRKLWGRSPVGASLGTQHVWELCDERHWRLLSRQMSASP